MTHKPIYGIWHGGSSYGHGSQEDLERFRSIEHASQVMRSRMHDGAYYKQEFLFVNQNSDETFTPCVDDDSYIDIYSGKDDFYNNHYGPSYRLVFGPRGGIQRKFY